MSSDASKARKRPVSILLFASRVLSVPTSRLESVEESFRSDLDIERRHSVHIYYQKEKETGSGEGERPRSKGKFASTASERSLVRPKSINVLREIASEGRESTVLRGSGAETRRDSSSLPLFLPPSPREPALQISASSKNKPSYIEV